MRLGRACVQPDGRCGVLPGRGRKLGNAGCCGLGPFPCHGRFTRLVAQHHQSFVQGPGLFGALLQPGQPERSFLQAVNRLLQGADQFLKMFGSFGSGHGAGSGAREFR